MLERLGSGSLHGVVGYMRSASKGWALLSERVDGDVQEHVRLTGFRAAVFEHLKHATWDVGSTFDMRP